MKAGAVHKFMLLGLVLLYYNDIHSQILKHPDPTIILDKSKAIVAINPCISGSFYLNEFYLTDINANDTVYIYNLKPGNYYIKFTALSSTAYAFNHFNRGKVQMITPCHDSISISPLGLKSNQLAYELTGGKTIPNRIKRSSYFSLLQFAAINFALNLDNASTSFFQTFTIINGYQFAPGFCTGIGVAYNYYPIDKMTSWGYDYQKVRINFIPLFADIRAHLPQKGKHASPYFKLDLGYNFLLHKSHLDANYYGQDYVMNKGGIYFSPGFGFRIFISDLVQIITAVEYSYEKSSFKLESPDYGQNNTVENKLSFLKISLGVAFQYK